MFTSYTVKNAGTTGSNVTKRVYTLLTVLDVNSQIIGNHTLERGKEDESKDGILFNIIINICSTYIVFCVLVFNEDKVNKMKKNFKSVMLMFIATFFILSVIVGVLIWINPFENTALSFTPVYCNDYSFTCCGEWKDPIVPQVVTLNMGTGWQCPSTASRCVIASSGNAGYYIGSQNCGYSFGLRFGGGWYYHCSDDIKYSQAGATMQPNQVLTSGLSITQNFQVQLYKYQLLFTGRSTDLSAGEPVIGANGCTFALGSTYTDDGKLITVDPSKTSYTVPFQACYKSYVAGDRHICGNLEEQCNVDTDCVGHTYGNKECIGNTLQTYGCTKLNAPSNMETYQDGYAYKTFVDNGATSANGVLSRCEIKSAVTVQCCGDNQCGTNAFCDKTTWTCKNKVSCTQNTDCGVSQQCDFTTKQIKTPICSFGTCTFSIKNVECCSDSNCAYGYFCDTDNECKEQTVPKTQCPFMCCVNEINYFDRLCVVGETCCGDNSCHVDCNGHDDDDDKECGYWLDVSSLGIKIPNYWCLFTRWLGNITSVIAISLGIIGGLLTLFMVRGAVSQFKIKEDTVTWIAMIVLSLVAGFFIGWLIKTLWWLAIIILIAMFVINIVLRKFGLK